MIPDPIDWSSGLRITVWAVLAGVLLLWVGLGHAQPGDPLSPAAQQSIADILKAKSQRTPAQRKLSSQLLDAAARQPGPAADVQAGPTRSAGDQDTMVTVDIRADVTDAVLARIRALGGTVISSIPEYRAIRARLPLTALETLAELDAVSSIRPPEDPILRRMPARDAMARAVVMASGGVNTEGDAAHAADTARQTYSIDGSGIGIGVISDGVKTRAARKTTKDLPEVTVLTGQEGGPFQTCTGPTDGDEGTAMLEIIHDLAPGADLFFATADSGNGPASMAKNIKDLCAAGADVIVDDIGWLFAPAFQDDVIAQAVSEVVAYGCSYFSAAGNSGNLNDGTAGVWEGDFSAGTALTLSGVSAVFHDFGGGVTRNEIMREDFPFSPYIVLKWADPVGDSANDYDLFLLDTWGNVIAHSTNIQDGRDGTDEPIETILRCANDKGNSIVIVKNAGAADRYLRLNYLGQWLEVATAGQTFGHAASQDAIGVAAVRALNSRGQPIDVFTGAESVEWFSSDGPRRIFFEADGRPITPGDFSSTGGKVLQKPDLTAADGVSTSTPGFERFFGTSAAAPHAAGIAALMLEAGGGPARVTPQALREAMTGSALDIEAPDVDRDSGAGIVMAPAAIGALTASEYPQTLAPGGTAATIDLDTEFSGLSGTKTYELLSSDSDPVTPSLTGSTLTLTPKTPGRVTVVVRATQGQVKVLRTIPVTVQVGLTDYCQDYGPCSAGQGDCDPGQCGAGLVCAPDVGARYGLPAHYDVCEAPGQSPNPDYCQDYGPCSAGQGDCDPGQCGMGLVCAADVGARYGLPAHYDVCEAPGQSPNPDLCRDYGPCGVGQGDCDPGQCGVGLVCVADVGAQYGLPAHYDVCEVPPDNPNPAPDPDYCRDYGPCGVGQGDCDPGQCGVGLVCVADVGAQYGLPAHYDVCEVAPGG